MPRFFRRLAEGVFDLEDMHRRTAELAGFIRAAAREYGFVPEGLVAVGFSNGANIAASMLLSDPAVLPGAVLLRAMVPFELEVVPSLAGHRVWIGAGRVDPIVPPDHAERLARCCGTVGRRCSSIGARQDTTWCRRKSPRRHGGWGTIRRSDSVRPT